MKNHIVYPGCSRFLHGVHRDDCGGGKQGGRDRLLRQAVWRNRLCQCRPARQRAFVQRADQWRVIASNGEIVNGRSSMDP